MTLTVAGDGPSRASLEAMAGDGVRFVGAVDPSRRGALFADTDGSSTPRDPSAAERGSPRRGARSARASARGGRVRRRRRARAHRRRGPVLPADAPPESIADAIDEFDPARRADLGACARARAAPWRWDATAAWIEALTGARFGTQGAGRVIPRHGAHAAGVVPWQRAPGRRWQPETSWPGAAPCFGAVGLRGPARAAAMADAVEAALDGGGTGALVEAGTGTGKSLAYPRPGGDELAPAW